MHPKMIIVHVAPLRLWPRFAMRSKWRLGDHAARRPCSTYSHEEAESSDMADDAWPHPIFVSEEIRDHKSIFLAHATHLPDEAALPTFLDNLRDSPALKKSTHFIYAYRACSQNAGSTIISGQHDGGEKGGGERLARLLELSDCRDVVVVVSRWYGGVKIGSDRWKRISDVAKDALKRGGFLSQATSDRVSGRREKIKSRGKRG